MAADGEGRDGEGVSDSWIGRIVGNCRIEQKIGEGGCGQVYRAVDVMLDRTVAVKVLHPGLAGRRDLAERFRSEALVLARLSHPNVATLYSLHQERDTYLMVMEYVQGKTFDELLRERGRMAPEEVVPLVVQALDGIHHAHELGIIHRDLKGSNAMRALSGVVKVMDFGIARALGTPGLTQVDHPVGTPEYMSPEQVRGEDIDARSDVYSVGVLLFKMLAGRLPFLGKSPFDLMRAQVEQVPPSLREFVPTLPPALEEVVLRALAKERDARFESAAALGVALEEACGKPAPEPADGTPTPTSGLDAKTTPIPLIELAATAPHEAPTRPLGVAPTSDAERTAPVASTPSTPSTPSTRRHAWIAALGLAAALVLVLGGALWRADRRPAASPDLALGPVVSLPPIEAMPYPGPPVPGVSAPGSPSPETRKARAETSEAPTPKPRTRAQGGGRETAARRQAGRVSASGRKEGSDGWVIRRD